MKNEKKSGIAVMVFLVLCCTIAHATDFYVSASGSDSNDGSINAPFKTVAKARDAVRLVSSNMTGNINVYLRGGWHQLSSPLTFTSSDSGTNGYSVIYQAYPGEYPVISGGQKITGWTLYDASKNIWRAAAPGLNTRQLYVNCVRATRAHRGSGLPGAVKTTTGYTTTDTTMQNWGNKSDIEFVYNAVQGGTNGSKWTESRCGVASISGTTITMKQPCWNNCLAPADFAQISNPTDIENAYELLDQPGEWYLDRTAGVVFYIPHPGEDISTAEVIAPVLETLVSGTGTLASPIKNIQFKGITFAHATWLRPSGNDGFPEAQGNYCYGYGWTSANIAFKTVQSLRFERCVFKHLGAIGLELSGGAQNCVVAGCVFTDISGNCIRIGDVIDPTRADTRARDDGDQVVDCYIHDSPSEFHGGIGLFSGYVSNLLVSHNEIGNTPYSTISCGWGWGTNSYAQNNQITFNNLYGFVKSLGDGGAIYTMSSQPGSTWNHNYAHDIPWGDYSGKYQRVYYPDEGSAYIDIHDNVSARIGNAYWFVAWTSSIHDNTIHDNYTDTSNYQDSGTNNTMTNNTVVTGGNWPQAALSIMATAGIESSYSDVKTMPCACSMKDCVVTSKLSDAKAVADGAKVLLPAAIVTGKPVASDSVARTYVEMPDRSSGISLLNAPGLSIGDQVLVSGNMTTVGGERSVYATSIWTTQTGVTVPRAVYLTNKSLGGSASGLQSSVIDSFSTTSWGRGLNNIGLLVIASGVITYIDPSWAYFYIEDGSRISDGSGQPGVRVDCSGFAIPPLGTDVMVTGLMGATLSGGETARLIRLRSEDDIAVLSNMNYLKSSGFETGTLQNWTTYGGVDGVHSGPWVSGMPQIGSHSGNWFLGTAVNGMTKSGGVYQQVTIPAGKSCYAQAWSETYRDMDPPGTVRNRIGIDPTGGTNSSGANVQWSPLDMPPVMYQANWITLTTPTVTSAGGRVTVFLDMKQAGGGWHINCFDDAGLYLMSF